jgi:hypothetical protein
MLVTVLNYCQLKLIRSLDTQQVHEQNDALIFLSLLT